MFYDYQPISIVMKWLIKIEDLINKLLLLCFGRVYAFILRLIPAPIKKLANKIIEYYTNFKLFIKNIPLHLKSLPKILKAQLAKINFSEIINDFKVKMAEAKQKSKNAGLKGIIKAYLLALKDYLYHWMKEIGFGYSATLLVLTVSSIFYSYTIYFQSKQLLGLDIGREPASVESEVEFRRPQYYKLDQRELTFHNFYIPVYFPKVNEVRSINVDFSLITSNRATKKYLSKYDFELRNHVIMHFEPIEASFALTPEGKEVIKDKILNELNNFLRDNKVDGKVLSVRIVYLLSH